MRRLVTALCLVVPVIGCAAAPDAPSHPFSAAPSLPWSEPVVYGIDEAAACHLAPQAEDGNAVFVRATGDAFSVTTTAFGLLRPEDAPLADVRGCEGAKPGDGRETLCGACIVRATLRIPRGLVLAGFTQETTISGRHDAGATLAVSADAALELAGSPGAHNENAADLDDRPATPLRRTVALTPAQIHRQCAVTAAAPLDVPLTLRLQVWGERRHRAQGLSVRIAEDDLAFDLRPFARACL